MTAWPIPRLPATIKTEKLEIKDKKWLTPLFFDTLTAKVTYKDKIEIHDSLLMSSTSEIKLTGIINTHQTPPEIKTILKIKNHENLITALQENKALTENAALWTNAGLNALKKENYTEIPLRTVQNSLYGGPLKIRVSFLLSKRRRSVKRFILNFNKHSKKPRSVCNFFRWRPMPLRAQIHDLTANRARMRKHIIQICSIPTSYSLLHCC